MKRRDKIVLDKSIFDAYNAMAAESEYNSLEFLRDVITYAFCPADLTIDLSNPCNVFATAIIDKDNPIDNSKKQQNIQLSIMRNIVYYIITVNSFIAMICTCSLGSVSEKIVFVSSVLTLLALLLMSAYTIACEEDIEEDGESNLKRFLKERGGV